MPSIDPETPPDQKAKMEQHAKWMSEEPPDAESEEEYTDALPETEVPKDFDDVKSMIQKPPKRQYRATLKHELYTVTFSIEDISIADYQLAIKIPRNDFRFEPTPQSRFILEAMGEKYPLVYIGGLFDFPSDKTWALTFVLDYDSPSADELK